jgi:hypothetical protein
MPPPERRASDTPRSYAALCDYAAMGAGRSLSLLAKAYRDRTDVVPTKQESRLGYWSAKDDWQARVATYDAAILAEAEAQRGAIRARRRAELEDRDWSEGLALRDRVLELLAEMPRFLKHTETEIKQGGELVKVITLALKAGPGELARALELASKLQRLSVGEATEQSTQTIEIRYADYDIDPETPA